MTTFDAEEAPLPQFLLCLLQCHSMMSSRIAAKLFVLYFPLFFIFCKRLVLSVKGKWEALQQAG